jgi:hypothetical protein
MSVIPPLSGDKQTFGERAKNDASHRREIPGDGDAWTRQYRSQPNGNLLDEIQKRSDLRRREVARGMIGIERIEFFRPFRQDLTARDNF